MYGVRKSCPVPSVRTARRRLVRVARPYSTEAPGRTCQHSPALAHGGLHPPRRERARRGRLEHEELQLVVQVLKVAGDVVQVLHARDRDHKDFEGEPNSRGIKLQTS